MNAYVVLSVYMCVTYRFQQHEHALAATDLRGQACPRHSWADRLLLLLTEQTRPVPPLLSLWIQLLPLPPENTINQIDLRF